MQSIIDVVEQLLPSLDRIILVLGRDLSGDLVVIRCALVHIQEAVNVIILDLEAIAVINRDSPVQIPSLSNAILKNEVIYMRQDKVWLFGAVVEDAIEEELGVIFTELLDSDGRFVFVSKLVGSS